MRVEVKTLAVTTLVGIFHVVAGITTYLVPAALNSTPLAGFTQLVRWFGWTDVHASFILLAVGIMAILASRLRFASHVLMLFPQQALLILQLWSITAALTTGQYPDGYIPAGGGGFILTDQLPLWLLTVSHSAWLIVFIYHGVRGRWRKSLKD